MANNIPILHFDYTNPSNVAQSTRLRTYLEGAQLEFMCAPINPSLDDETRRVKISIEIPSQDSSSVRAVYPYSQFGDSGVIRRLKEDLKRCKKSQIFEN